MLRNATPDAARNSDLRRSELRRSSAVRSDTVSVSRGSSLASHAPEFGAAKRLPSDGMRGKRRRAAVAEQKRDLGQGKLRFAQIVVRQFAANLFDEILVAPVLMRELALDRGRCRVEGCGDLFECRISWSKDGP